MKPYLYIRPEIQAALDEKQPVVALESTLITHGLPYPTNRDTALAMETEIRAVGAIPATIAIIQGKIHVGLSANEIEYLAQAPDGQVRKCSRRDLAITLAQGGDGATTVASTMLIAQMARIPVFATGGIGGVHRGHPFDVSADLIELGRTPIAVVCSGAKSILDLPLTLEVLETQGVPVLGYKTDTLPTFFTRESDLPIDQRVDAASEAAQIIRTAQQLRLNHGILIAVPVPTEHEIQPDVVNPAIIQATEEADQQRISGKAITPFILGRVADLTKGKSMAANIALLRNNARVAAQIAHELA